MIYTSDIGRYGYDTDLQFQQDCDLNFLDDSESKLAVVNDGISIGDRSIEDLIQ